MPTTNQGWDSPRWAAEQFETAIRGADKAGEVWTHELAEVLRGLRRAQHARRWGLARRLERRVGRLVSAVSGAPEPEALEPLLAFETDTVDALVAEHARCLNEAQIERLANEQPAALLRNPALGADAQVATTRRLLAPLHDPGCGKPWSDADLDGVRAALSLPGPIKEAGWAGMNHGAAEENGLRALATPHPCPDLIADVAVGSHWGRMVALTRPDLPPAMEDRLLGGDGEMRAYLVGSWHTPYDPSVRVMRRTLELWPGCSVIAYRIARFPGAPLDVLQRLARTWHGESTSRLFEELSRRDDALSNPEIRGALSTHPAAHSSLIFEATEDEFPALFRSEASRFGGAENALDALDVQLGRGRRHGLQCADLAPILALGGPVAERGLDMLLEVDGRSASSRPCERDEARSR